VHWKAGDPIVTRDTEVMRWTGVPPGTRGYVCHVTADRVSFFLNHSGYGLEASIDRARFGQSFEPAVFAPSAGAYARSTHFPNRFPEDFTASR
jgi:hypothetical protein